jgi:tight adherence protein C
MTAAMGYGAFALIALAFGLVVFVLGRNQPVDVPRTGMRGLKRERAIAKGGLYPAVEPLLRFTGSWFASLPLSERRTKIDRQLMLSGEWLGLTPNEFFAMSLLSSVLFGTIGIVFIWVAEFDMILAIVGFVVGALLPYFRARGEMLERHKAVNRGLPTAIDLASLCMGAGLDFPGAMRQVVDKAVDKSDPLTEEIQRILQELELGRTRRQALESFAERVPIEAVLDFVGSVVQADEKGNPLAEVLRIQAQQLRLRRSIRAEELAARAAVMLMGPLVLIFCAIILILLGPFIINGMNSGF